MQYGQEIGHAPDAVRKTKKIEGFAPMQYISLIVLHLSK